MKPDVEEVMTRGAEVRMLSELPAGQKLLLAWAAAPAALSRGGTIGASAKVLPGWCLPTVSFTSTYRAAIAAQTAGGMGGGGLTMVSRERSEVGAIALRAAVSSDAVGVAHVDALCNDSRTSSRCSKGVDADIAGCVAAEGCV